MSLPQAAAPVCFVLTADRARSKPFYAEVLGLRLLGEDAHAATFDLGNRTPLRLTDMPGHRGTGHTVVGWNVADLVGTARVLRAKGVTFTIYEGFGQDADGIWHSPDGGAKVAWFADPDGNLLSLTQFG
ncbi:MAG: VOC family protein [Sphingomonadaceae bacterium]|nr:VOC family protein [Sphingomonadaceae bacterium]